MGTLKKGARPNPALWPISLKIWRAQYEAVRDGRKPFEWRKEDGRPFEVGHVLKLAEWNEDAQRYTGRHIRRVVTYVLRNTFNVPAGYAVLGLAKIPRRWR